MKTFSIEIKSHTYAPDFTADVKADKFVEAANMFYEMLHGEYDLDFIKESMIEN